MAPNRPQTLIRIDVRSGSIATDPFSTKADQCPLLGQ